MAYEREARTAFASKALELSDMFMIKFGRRALGGTTPRTVHVAPPEESTAGGKLAREAISLIPAGGAPGATLVVGWMNVAENQAELRSYEVLAEIHRQRFRSELDLSAPDYEGFLEDARRFFSEEAIALEIASEPPAPPQRSVSATSASPAPAQKPAGAVPIVAPLAVEDGLSFSAGVVAAMVGAALLVGIGIGWALF